MPVWVGDGPEDAVDVVLVVLVVERVVGVPGTAMQ